MSYDCCLSGDNRLLAVHLPQPTRFSLAKLQMILLYTLRWVRVFDTATGAEVCKPIREGCLCCFAPDGKTLAVADRYKGIALWDWPPPSRWPLMLALAAPTMMLSYGMGFWWSRRLTPNARGDPSSLDGFVDTT